MKKDLTLLDVRSFVLLLYFLSVRKGCADSFAELTVCVVNGVKGYRVELYGVDFTVLAEDFFVSRNVCNFAYADSVLVEFYKLTLNRHRQLLNYRSVYKLRFDRCEACLSILSGVLLPETMPT